MTRASCAAPTSLERAADALAALVPTDVESANLLAVSTALVRAATRAP